MGSDNAMFTQSPTVCHCSVKMRSKALVETLRAQDIIYLYFTIPPPHTLCPSCLLSVKQYPQVLATKPYFMDMYYFLQTLTHYM